MKSQTLIQAREGKLNPLEAVMQLDAEIGGITAVIWNPGAGNYRIANHIVIVALPMRNTNKKEQQRLQEVATLAYWMAQRNRSTKPGEVHLERGCSTKHYAEDFRAYTQELLTKYSLN